MMMLQYLKTRSLTVATVSKFIPSTLAVILVITHLLVLVLLLLPEMSGDHGSLVTSESHLTNTYMALPQGLVDITCLLITLHHLILA